MLQDHWQSRPSNNAVSALPWAEYPDRTLQRLHNIYVSKKRVKEHQMVFGYSREKVRLSNEQFQHWTEVKIMHTGVHQEM